MGTIFNTIDDTVGVWDKWTGTPGASARGAAAANSFRKGTTKDTWEQWNIPRLDRIDFDMFLVELVARHGPEYLQRPDGEPLAIVDPQGIPRGYAIPKSRYRKAKYTRPKQYNELPPDVYSGSGREDLHLQDRNKVQVRANGNYTVTHTVTGVLRKFGPLLWKDVVAKTGLDQKQVTNCLVRYQGQRYNKRADGKWEAIDEQVGQSSVGDRTEEPGRTDTRGAGERAETSGHPV